MSMTTVTDADREAYLAFNMLPAILAADVRAGKWDELSGLQIIARHRQAAILEGMEIALNAAIERLGAIDVEAALQNLNTPTGRATILAAHTRAKEEV